MIQLINGKQIEIDLIIAKDNYPVAVVEVKRSLDKCSLSSIESRLQFSEAVLYAPLCIVCSSKEMFSCFANERFDKNDRKYFNEEKIKQVLESINRNDDVTIDEIKLKWRRILEQFESRKMKSIALLCK